MHIVQTYKDSENVSIKIIQNWCIKNVYKLKFIYILSNSCKIYIFKDIFDKSRIFQNKKCLTT